MAKKTKEAELREKLMYNPKTAWNMVEEKQKQQIFDYCEGYKVFLDQGKTEREVCAKVITMAQQQGFKNLDDCIKNKTELTTKKSIEMKEKIQKISNKFTGNMNDKEVISTLGIARNTYYKYIREIKGGE